MLCVKCQAPAVCQIKIQTLDAYCQDCAPEARREAGRNDGRLLAVTVIGMLLVMAAAFGSCLLILGG